MNNLQENKLEPAAHMYPSDLERFEENETFATAFSVAVGRPEESSEPLYRLGEIRRWLKEKGLVIE
jgi:hypothetical protein